MLVPIIASAFQSEEVKLEKARSGLLAIITVCGRCHNDSSTATHKLNLTSQKAILKGGRHGAAAVPKNLEKSHVWVVVNAANKDGGWESVNHNNEKIYLSQMPPLYPLPSRTIEAIKMWIEMGCPDFDK